MNLDDRLHAILKQPVISRQQLNGGDIGQSFLITTKDERYFCKQYPGNPQKIAAEVQGLQALSQVGYLNIPKVVAASDDCMVLEFIIGGAKTDRACKALGISLAQHHQIQQKQFGFMDDNFLGHANQINRSNDSWPDFYWNNRINFQIEWAQRDGKLDDDEYQKLKKSESRIKKLTDLPDLYPSLIHGDLWAGNYLISEDQRPYLIDPSVYYAHHEMELGMTYLFGGFPDSFYEGYHSIIPRTLGWEKRVEIYKLYHILNHYNLFGGSYLNSALAIVSRL